MSTAPAAVADSGVPVIYHQVGIPTPPVRRRWKRQEPARPAPRRRGPGGGDSALANMPVTDVADDGLEGGWSSSIPVCGGETVCRVFE